MTNQRERVGIIGAGRMGLAMVKHLIARGFEVTACDINQGNREKARDLGATIVETPSDIAQAASFVILGVGYDAEVMAVTLGQGGLFATMKSGTLIAVSATVAPATVKSLAEAARAGGCDVLDAPICRGRWFADAGKLLALFGGAPEAIARGRAVYDAFCSDIATLGEVGHGQVAKAVNNLLLWIGSIGLIEAGRIAEASGIDLPTLRAALMMSSAKSQALEDWEQTSFTWALKDMQIVSALTDEAGLSLPLTGAVKELVKEARRIKATNPPGWSGGTAAR